MRNNFRFIFKVVLALILLGISIYFLVNNQSEVQTIYNKAIFVCFECVGIG